MKMKYLSIIMLLFFLSSYSCAEDNNDDKILRYFEVTDVLGTIDRQMVAYIEDIKYAYPDLSSKIIERREVKQAVEDYKREVITAWTQILKTKLSNEELSEMLAFIETPLGKKFIALQEKLGPEFDEVGSIANRNLNDKISRLLFKTER